MNEEQKEWVRILSKFITKDLKKAEVVFPEAFATETKPDKWSDEDMTEFALHCIVGSRFLSIEECLKHFKIKYGR